MKKLIALLLALTVMLSLAACGKTPDTPDKPDSGNSGDSGNTGDNGGEPGNRIYEGQKIKFWSPVGDVGFFERLSEAYYEKTGCDIIAHFDLLTKFNDRGDLFDTNHSRYKAAADKAMDALLKTPAALEVNFGAIARGYTTKPYPEKTYLTRWLAAGKRVCYSSDCHEKSHLLDYYEDYKQLLSECR